MQYINIDFVIDNSFRKVFTKIPTVTQYSSNYKVRVVFTDKNFNPDILKLSINNGKILPGRAILLSNKKAILKDGLIEEVDTGDFDGYIYEYPISQYDTEIFTENLNFTISGYDKDSNLLGVITEKIPMEKSTFSNFLLTYLEEDSSLNRVIEKINDLQNQINILSERNSD